MGLGCRLAVIVGLGIAGGAQAAVPTGPKPSLKAAAALVADQATGEWLLEKNAEAVVPIASLTKLMTAMVVQDANLDHRASITIGAEDVDMLRHSRSHLPVGTVLTRDEAVLLALLASENRAAHALGRTFPGGKAGCVAAMNAKAKALGLRDTRFDDTSGLSGENVSSARDLVRILDAAMKYPKLRDFTTRAEAEIHAGGRTLTFPNTNALVRGGAWSIGLSKTGYIDEAGPCLAMQAKVANRSLLMVFLDAPGKFSRLGDAVRIRQWLEGPVLVKASGARKGGPRKATARSRREVRKVAPKRSSAKGKGPKKAARSPRRR